MTLLKTIKTWAFRKYYCSVSSEAWKGNETPDVTWEALDISVRQQ